MPAYPSQEAMTPIVEKMVALMQADEKIANAIKSQDFSFAADLTDLKAKYYISFRAGQVAGGVGDDPQGTTLTLKMSSATFDDLFSGVKDAMGLAMTGKISFSGNTSAGMTLMGVMGNIQRAYKAAKAG
jgi:putative sterol carrier protein